MSCKKYAIVFTLALGVIVGLVGCAGTSNSATSSLRSASARASAASSTSSAVSTAEQDAAGTWTDAVYTYDGGTMNYSVFMPSGYDSKTTLPLVTYIPDATYAGKSLADLKAAQCPIAWITTKNMSAHPCAFLVMEISSSGSDINDSSSDASRIVPIVDEVRSKYAIDEKRLYLTGQSMGGIFDFAVNDAYPDKFAATVYVGCQPGGEVDDNQYRQIIANEKYVNQTFVYIASAKDAKAPKGQEAIMQVLDSKGVTYGLRQDIDHNGGDATESAVKAVLDKGHPQNILQFAQVADGSSSKEHMESFQYAYGINAIFDWLLSQSK